jgi:hypothetical protein
MPARRIIPCLDVREGRVVKGVQFRDHRDVGDIVEHALPPQPAWMRALTRSRSTRPRSNDRN